VRGALEQCPLCLQTYLFELERRCDGCDERLCPWCVVEVRIEIHTEAPHAVNPEPAASDPLASEESASRQQARQHTRRAERMCPGCMEESTNARARNVES
jgi:hypothetical protein